MKHTAIKGYLYVLSLPQCAGRCRCMGTVFKCPPCLISWCRWRDINVHCSMCNQWSFYHPKVVTESKLRPRSFRWICLEKYKSVAVLCKSNEDFTLLQCRLTAFYFFQMYFSHFQWPVRTCILPPHEASVAWVKTEVVSSRHPKPVILHQL